MFTIKCYSVHYTITMFTLTSYGKHIRSITFTANSYGKHSPYLAANILIIRNSTNYFQHIGKKNYVYAHNIGRNS